MREHGSRNSVPYRRSLYPPREPSAQFVLEVPGGHQLYAEESGKVDGVPVVVLHGGPGGGCSPAMRRFFDPNHYRSILFDQRGCGRSVPHASVENNTTHDLIADIELLREHLGIERWYVFGGSWGATLALLYAQAHPSRVQGIILRGVFLMMQTELDWFYNGGVARFWPEEWERFTALIPMQERGDMIAAYRRRLFGPDRAEQVRYARAWAAWESNLAALESHGRSSGGSGEYARAFSRIENHYFSNLGWIEEGQILDQVARLKGIPGYIVQGRYDMICPPVSAWSLNQAWPDSELRSIRTAGHALSEPGITAELVAVMEELKEVEHTNA